MKNFSKVLLMTIFGSLIYSSSAKADFDHYAIKNNIDGGFSVYTCVNSTGTCTEKASKSTPGRGWDIGGSYLNNNNELVIMGTTGDYVTTRYFKYDPVTNQLTEPDDWKDTYTGSFEKRLLTKDSSGIISIGENSLKLKETATEQQLWGTNSSGQIVPINITNGSKLLINGRDVEQSIDNVGALSAALTALPTVPTDSPIACGIGTGTHSGNYAFSGGCASKVNEKLSFNAAASFVPGQDYQGTDNSYSARAGFVFKLGNINKDKLISKKENQLDQKVTNLQTENKELKSLIALQNTRLEKLEKIALSLKIQSSPEMISVATKD